MPAAVRQSDAASLPGRPARPVLLPISQRSKRTAGVQWMDAVLLCPALFALRCSAFGLLLSALGPTDSLCCNLPNIVASQVAFPSSNKRSDQRRVTGTRDHLPLPQPFCSTRLPASGCCCPSEPTHHWSLRPGQRPDLHPRVHCGAGASSYIVAFFKLALPSLSPSLVQTSTSPCPSHSLPRPVLDAAPTRSTPVPSAVTCRCS